MSILNQRSWQKNTAPDSVIYVDLANTKNGEILETQTFTWENAPSRARRVLTPGDTIVGTVRPGNRSFALVPTTEYQLTGSTGFAVISPRSPEWTEFNYIALTANESIERLSHLADGGAYPAVRPEVVTDLEMTLPPESVLNAFHQMCMPFFAWIERNRKQSPTLAELRDSLLPKLLSGELTLPAAQTQATEALG